MTKNPEKCEEYVCDINHCNNLATTSDDCSGDVKEMGGYDMNSFYEYSERVFLDIGTLP